MAERSENTQDTQALGEVERLEEAMVGDPPAAKGGRSRKPTDQPGPGTATDSEAKETAGMELVPTEESDPSVGPVPGHLTIRELEMIPKMEELRTLEEIPVGGRTNIEPEVIAAISGAASQAVPGVSSLGTASLRRSIRERVGSAERRARGIEVEVGRREVILDINLRVIYGYSIPAVVIQVREVVADRLLRLGGLEAKEINVKVIGIEFPDRTPGRVD